jgi:hypothetical protein
MLRHDAGNCKDKAAPGGQFLLTTPVQIPMNATCSGLQISLGRNA